VNVNFLNAAEEELDEGIDNRFTLRRSSNECRIVVKQKLSPDTKQIKPADGACAGNLLTLIYAATHF
jgi:hypothetical protein